MTKIEWVFNTYPETYPSDIQNEEDRFNSWLYSDEVLVKNINGEVYIASYCSTKKAWYDSVANEWMHWSHIVCWASLGKVPESLTPMPKPERSNNGEV